MPTPPKAKKLLERFFVVKKRLPANYDCAPYFFSTQDSWTLDHADARIWRTRVGAESFVMARMLQADVIEVTVNRSLFRWSEKQVKADADAA